MEWLPSKHLMDIIRFVFFVYTLICMIIKQITNSIFNSNTFVINDKGKAIIIDIGDFQPVKDYLKQNSFIPAAVLITHVHYDHIYGLPEFMKTFPDVPIFTSKEGIESFKNPKWNFSRYHDDSISIESPQIHIFTDFQNFNVFNNLKEFEIKAFPTPGHDHSCLTYQINDLLFTGDSFIPDVKVVATFPKSDKILAKHWYDKLLSMSKEFTIYPGHGPILHPKQSK